MMKWPGNKYVTDGIVETEHFLNEYPENLVEEASAYLRNAVPEKSPRLNQGIETVIKAIGGAALFGLTIWVVSKGEHGIYQQVIDGFRNME